MTTEPRASGASVTRRLAALVALIIGAVIGASAGASLHYQSSVGGLDGALAGAFTFVGLAAAVGVSALIALIAALIHRTGVALAFAAFAGGLVLGGVAGLIVGPTYQPPTIATGTVKVVLTQPAVEWTSRASCISVENGSTIATVRASEVATLDDQAVWLTVGLGDDASGPARLEIGQPADSDRTPPYPYRAYVATGPGLSAETPSDGRRAGVMRFADLALAEGPPFPLDPPVSHLAGRVEWTCELPAAQGGPDPEVIGRLEGHLSMIAVAGDFGVDFALEGDCRDPFFGLSDWTGLAKATNGRQVRGEMQLEGEDVIVALYLDPDSKETPYRIRFPRESGGPGKTAMGLLQPMQTAEFGELKIIGEWRCRT